MALDDMTYPVAGRFARAIAAITTAYCGWRDGCRNRIALSRLSDAELSDIGLSRGELELRGDDGLRGR
ncbi:DUF1127 domain-containing protein [Tropicimonas sp. IMCC34043]|uniref:DUF1127 domain-containing protein n=1 Tax=Tropicimonas sp. IMCC34043 TaxID=2248760 RepID=UPI0013006D34|nr:DUF1127 domain-containing protein [Tropicimonas sp. IMCC34043]